jgi:hypothetical protein
LTSDRRGNKFTFWPFYFQQNVPFLFWTLHFKKREQMRKVLMTSRFTAKVTKKTTT